MRGGSAPPTPYPPQENSNCKELIIDQLDGNITLLSDITVEESCEHYIPSYWGYRPEKSCATRLPPIRKRIRRDNRSVQALTLPRVLNYNMRSIFSKIENFSEDMLEREGDINFVTEIWQKQENKKHQQKIEKMFELSGISYISTPRPGAQRGGGAAIAVRTQKFTISKLNILIPKSVEVVWGLLRPKSVTGKISTIIVCCFYSPPRSRKNSALVDHLTVTLHSLLKIHSGAGVIISGDRNSIEIPTLLSIDPTLRQIVKVPTRGLRILDVIITNLARYYNDPITVPPIIPDNPGFGAPSDHDHMGVFVTPNASSFHVASRTKVTKMIRPLPESLLPAFEEKITTQLQQFRISEELSSTQIVQSFQDTLNILVSDTFSQRKKLINPEVEKVKKSQTERISETW